MPLKESIAALVSAAPPDAVVPVRWLGELLAREDQAGEGDDTVDLTVAQLALRFGKGKSTIRTWLERGEFPGAYRQHGREWRVPTSAVAAMQRRQAEEYSPFKQQSVSPSRRAPNIGEWRGHMPKAS